MAFRYLIYSTGTTFTGTIIRESGTDNPGTNEASFYSDFNIPSIQPLYLWRVTGSTGSEDVVPNTDTNIYNYLQSIAPPLSPEDDATVGYVTGLTSNKIDKVTGATNDVPIFKSDGNIESSGYSIDDLTGATYNYVGSGQTEVTLSGETYIINTDVSWGDIDGNLSNQIDLQNALNNKLNVSDFNIYSGNTDSRINDVESDITYISGITDNNYNDLTSYTATTDSRLDDIEVITNVSVTGGTNGLTKDGRNLKLGGGLTEDTTISGSTHDLSVDVANITLKSAGNIDIIDDNGNSIDIESKGGSIDITGKDGLDVEKTKLSISDTELLITDSRSTSSGLEYNADYSNNFNSRSLVDKAYVDAIASGLDLKESVKVATTTGNTDIDLTGGTFGGTIDGYTVQDGDRVLVKNQTSNKEENGIWIYSSGGNTFGRAIDFDDPYVTSGAFTFVETGTENLGSGWVLVTQDPINIGVSELSFTQFSEAGQLTEGIGININGGVISVDGNSLAGDSISFTGNTFNVDVNNGKVADALDDKLNITDFDVYSGNTDSRLDDIENDITYVSGVTDTKLDESIFNNFTGQTSANELLLIHTGGTDLNTIITTGIFWDDVIVSGDSYNWTGGTDIYIQEDGDYEISYNIPFNSQTSNRKIGVGSNIILNNSVVLDNTSSGGNVSTVGIVDTLNIPSIVVNLSQNDKLTLGVFRTGKNGVTNSVENGMIRIKKSGTI